MSTFQQLYCAKHRCDAEQFRRRVFWHCLYPHARPLAGILRLLNGRYFVADESLIRSVAEAVTMRTVREEVRDYFWDSNNRGWLRRTANLRISGQRIKNLARHYLPESELAANRPGATGPTPPQPAHPSEPGPADGDRAS